MPKKPKEYIFIDVFKDENGNIITRDEWIAKWNEKVHKSLAKQSA